MTWLWWWAAVSVVSAVLFVAVWWHEVGRHDANERRNRRLHDGHVAHAGWFDAPAPDPVDDKKPATKPATPKPAAQRTKLADDDIVAAVAQHGPATASVLARHLEVRSVEAFVPAKPGGGVTVGPVERRPFDPEAARPRAAGRRRRGPDRVRSLPPLYSGGRHHTHGMFPVLRSRQP